MQAGASSSAALCGHLVRAWPCRFDLARAFSHSAWTQGSLCRWHIRRVSVLELWSQHLERSPLICAPVRPSENFFFLHRTPACGPPAPPPIAECLRPAPLPPPPPVTTPVPRSTTAPPARYTRLYFGSTAASGRRYGPVPAIDARWEPPTFTATGGNRAGSRHNPSPPQFPPPPCHRSSRQMVLQERDAAARRPNSPPPPPPPPPTLLAGSSLPAKRRPAAGTVITLRSPEQRRRRGRRGGERGWGEEPAVERPAAQTLQCEGTLVCDIA